MQSSPHINHPPPDATRIKWGLLVGFLVLLTIVVSFFTVKSGNPVFMVGVIAVPMIIILLSKPERTLYIALFASLTSLSILQVASLTDASILFSFAAFGCFMMVIFKREKYLKESGDKLLFIFLGVILIIMGFRGSGLKILGGTTWGGSPYILCFAAVFFYIFSRRLRLGNMGVKRLVFIALAGGIINSLMLRSGFVEASETMSEAGKVRLSWTTPIASAAIPLALIIKWKRSWIMAGLWLLTFGFIGLSGFRSRLVSFIVLSGGFFFFYTASRRAFVMKAILLVCMFWIGIIAVSSSLPLGLQRAVSFVPGAKIDFLQARSAESSSEWRLEIWKECLGRAPEYLLVGRGIAFDVMDTVSELGTNDVQMQSQWFMFLVHNYHSGPLTLLIDYGLPGLLSMLFIHIFFIGKCFRYGKTFVSASTPLERFALYYTALVLQQIFAFWIIFGKTDDLSFIIFNMGVLYIAHQSILDLQKKNETYADLPVESEPTSAALGAV
ncbi:O-antigen ligase family protein [Pontiellaceae bacterium B12227]|nr:O-antigen ligase family protein [Pontiellaceae bacterium B12227]